MNTRRAVKALSAVVAAFVSLSACADSSITSSTADVTDGPTASSSATTAEPTSPATSPSVTTTAPEGSTPVSSEQIDPGLKPYIDMAVADLAQRLSIDAAAITVTSATLEQWSDSSLGCPEPGREYAQAMTDGSLIVLDVNGKTYSYHAGGSRTPFLCEQPAKPTSTATPTTV